MKLFQFGKRLLTDDEILAWSYNPENRHGRSYRELQSMAHKASLLTSIIMVKLLTTDQFPVAILPRLPKPFEGSNHS